MYDLRMESEWRVDNGEEGDEMSELKKCLCCGSSWIYETLEIDELGTEIPIIFCNACKVVFKAENDSPYLNDKETWEYLKEKNRNAWNNRKLIEAVVERLEGLNTTEIKVIGGRCNDKSFTVGYSEGIREAINIIKAELGG